MVNQYLTVIEEISRILDIRQFLKKKTSYQPILLRYENNGGYKKQTMKKQKDKSKEKEYLMMREEILQYLEEYQTVRNMMYLVTATCLGFAVKDGEKMPVYLFLLPLIVIMPSYIIAIDYFNCVRKAATYLMVFHETNIDGLFRWETRHYMLVEFQKTKTRKVHVQFIPYYACGIACFILYFLNVELKVCKDVLIGIILLLVCVICILRFRKISNEAFLSEWERVKHEEIEKVKRL